MLDRRGSDEGGGRAAAIAERAPAADALRPAAADAGHSWEAPKGGDLDDEIPFYLHSFRSDVN